MGRGLVLLPSDVYIVFIDVDIVDIGAAMTYPGEFELMVLLAVLRLGDEAFAVEVLRELDERAGRQVSRGALYKTLERMFDKRLVEWDIEDTVPGRGGHPRRRFRVTRNGLAAVRLSRQALGRLSQGLDDVLEGEVL